MMVICVACTRGPAWRGKTKWYASDNRNTVGRLRDRYSQVVLVQFLLRCLEIAEGMWGFEVYGVYVRTYHNLIPDQRARDEWKAAEAGLQAEGFVKVSISKAWAFYLTEMQKQHEASLGALVVFGTPEDE